MVSKNICGFTTVNGKACKCYKMKGAEFCKSHDQYDWGSDIESESESESDSIYNLDILTVFHSEYSKRLDELERFARAYEKMEKDVSVMKAKMRQHNFIQMIVYVCLLSVFLHNNVQSEDMHLIVNDLTRYADMFMDVVRDIRSLIKNHYNYNMYFL